MNDVPCFRNEWEKRGEKYKSGQTAAAAQQYNSERTLAYITIAIHN